jgi:hypothetical protein
VKRNKTRKHIKSSIEHKYNMDTYTHTYISKIVKLFIISHVLELMNKNETRLYFNNIEKINISNNNKIFKQIIKYYKNIDDNMYNYLNDILCITMLYFNYSNNIETFRISNDSAAEYIKEHPDVYEQIVGKPYIPGREAAKEFAAIISDNRTKKMYVDIYDEICESDSWSMEDYNQIFEYLLENPSIPVYDTLFALAANSINVCGRPVSGLCRSAEELLSCIEMFDELNNGPFGDLPYDERPDIRGLLDALGNYGDDANVATWKRICGQFHERVKAKFNERFNWDEFSIEELY